MKKIYIVGLCSSLFFVSLVGNVAYANEEHMLEKVEIIEVETVPMPLDEPIDPSTPIDPIEPIDPSTPIDPIEPIDPSTPIDPIEPTDPSTPVEPTEPTEPSTPPVEPTEPTEPSTPPIEPEKPTQPVEPEIPSKPVDTVPSPQYPIETGTGNVVVGVANGHLILQQADGTTTIVSPETIGASKQANGTLVVKDSTGTLKVLPHTGEKKQAVLSILGSFIALGTSIFWFKRKRA